MYLVIALTWCILSFIALTIAVIVLRPARRELAESRVDLATVRLQAQPHKAAVILAEGLSDNARNLLHAHLMAVGLHALFLMAGVYSVLVPPAHTDYSTIRGIVVTLLLICGKGPSLGLQWKLFQMTALQRRNRRKLEALDNGPLDGDKAG